MPGTYDDQDRMIASGGATYTYTANGELASKTESGATTAYTYDELGNLTNVSLPSGNVIQFIIDGENRRVGKKVNNIVVRQWLYSGPLRIVAELDGSGGVISRFVYGTPANIPAFMVRGGKTYRIISDHLRSPRLVVDSTTGAVVERMDFDEFGNIAIDTNPGFIPFGFAGGLFDPDTGLVRFGTRDYDPRVGRWTAKDPIGFNGGDPNLLTYSFSDPINYVDPAGLAPPASGSVGVIIGGSVEGGVVAGAGATGALGGGIFYGPAHGVNIGAFAEGGAALGVGFRGLQAPSQEQFKSIGGGYAGVGVGGYVSNASCARDLRGPFSTYSFNVGWGPVKFGAQFAKSGSIWIFSVTPLGPSIGISGSGYPTTTRTTQ